MNARWVYGALAVGAGLGAALTAASMSPEPVLAGGVVEVPFELNGTDAGSCEVRVTDGVVDVLACDLKEQP